MKVLHSNKYIEPLLSNPSSDKIAEFTFRSFNEVKAFINKFDSIVAKSNHELLTASSITGKSAWVIPVQPIDGIAVKPVDGINATKLKRLTEALEKTHEQNQTLKTIQALVEFTFPQQAAELLPTLDKLSVEVNQALEKTIASINGMAIKIQPAAFGKLCRVLTKSVIHGLEGNYDGVFNKTLLTHTPEGPLFTYMIEFVNLVNKATGYTYEQFFIILSGKVVGKRMTVHCSTRHGFAPPSNHDLTNSVASEEEMLEEVNRLLSDDKFGGALVKPFSLTKTQISNVLSDVPGILSTDIDSGNHRLLVHFDISEAPEVYGATISNRMQNILGNGTVRYKVLPGTRTLEFQILSKAA